MEETFPFQKKIIRKDLEKFLSKILLINISTLNLYPSIEISILYIFHR